jgi:hypothetical protein
MKSITRHPKIRKAYIGKKTGQLKKIAQLSCLVIPEGVEPSTS